MHSCMCMAHEACSAQHWTETQIKERCVPLSDKEAVEIVKSFHKKIESCVDGHVCGVCGIVGLDGKGSLVAIDKLMCHAVDKDSDECAWSTIEVYFLFNKMNKVHVF